MFVSINHAFEVEIHRTATVEELILALNRIHESTMKISLGDNLSFYKELPQDPSKQHLHSFEAQPISSLSDLNWNNEHAELFAVADQPCYVFVRCENFNKTYSNVWKIGRTILMKGKYGLVET